MQTKSTAKTIVLSKGGWSTWRVTKFNAREFTAVNQRGVTHHYSNERDAVRFVEFLESKGYQERKQGASLNTVKRVAPKQQTLDVQPAKRVPSKELTMADDRPAFRGQFDQRYIDDWQLMWGHS